jgi:hypothetical protein
MITTWLLNNESEGGGGRHHQQQPPQFIRQEMFNQNQKVFCW